MLLYTSTINARVEYISKFLAKELGDKAFELTSDITTFKEFSGCKINYSENAITKEEFWIVPHTILFENKIKQQQIDCFSTDGYKAFFKTTGDFPFDIFAASFYLLSRYEEYLPHEEDIYGRYAHENSVAFKENFLTIPLVNIWLKDFKNKLSKQFSLFTIQHSPFTFLPTYDIDEAYSFKHKSWWRTTGAAVKDVLKQNFKQFNLRRSVIKNKVQDPFDAYAWMDVLHDKFKLKPRYFFLVPEKTGKYDRNILPKEAAVQNLINQHATKYKIGGHPSWQSGDDFSLIKKEKATIENIAAIKINSSRQHYIRFTLPQTFRYLIDAGIKEDFSMGYGSVNGFRASVASSFYWYDLEKEQLTDLLLYPFCYMEANSFYEQKYSAEQALEEMRFFYNEVKKVNGTFISIWHNTFLGTDEKFKGWREVYEKFIEEVCR